MKAGVCNRIHRLGVWLVCVLFAVFCMAAVTYAAPSGSVSVTLNSTETTVTVNFSNYQMPSDGQTLYVAVWSQTGGQDDIAWRPLTKSGSSYTVSFSVAEHKSSGMYFAHLYLRSKTGKMTFLNDTTFTVTKASMDAVTVKDMNVKAGTCKIEITGVKSPSGVTEVQVPVWSKSDQSDIIWYKAVNQGNGTWTVDLSFAKHGSNTGTYHIHVYATSKNKTKDFIGNTKTVYDPSASSTPETPAETKGVTAKLNGSSCDLKATGVTASAGVKTVYFAAWSKTDGQDDLIWNVASYDGTAKTATKTISLDDYCDYGIYYVHAYVQDSKGKMTLLGTTEFDLPYPSIKSAAVTTSGNSFTVTIKGISCVGGIDKVTVPIWSKSDQSDIVWYQAQKQSDGSYTVTSDISKHNNNKGTYTVHIYVYDGRDSYGHLVKTTTFNTGSTAGNLTVTANADKSVYTAEINDISVTGGYKSIQAAVWSKNQGQDDLSWYQCTVSGSSCSVEIPMSRHGDEGTYYLHLYAVKTDGSYVLLKDYTFEVTKPVEEDTNKLFYENPANGKVDVRLKLSTDIKAQSVSFPAWCYNDQSDIVWYQAVKQSDGSYKVTIDVANHSYHAGLYKVHAYYKDASGNLKFVCGSSVEISYTESNNPKRQATITSCKITGGNKVTVTATVTGSGEFGLFALKGEETGVGSGSVLATASGSGTLTFTTDLKANTANSLLNRKFVIGQRQSGSYECVSDGYYITNPEAIATNTRAFPTASTKKGLQVNTNMTSDAKDLGVKHSVINVVLNNIPCQSGGISYVHNGKTWHMDMGYIYSLDEIFSAQAKNGSIISAVLLMQWDDEWKDLIIASGRTSGHALYGLNAETQAAREQLEAIFCFLAERYSGANYNVVNWILGNEVDDYTNWNWCGLLGIDEYTAYYTHAFRLLYNSVKSCYSNARVYISFDHVWNYTRTYGFKSSEVFQRFVNLLKAEGDITWNIAYHPYPNPITSPNFWTNRVGAANSINAGFITMINLNYLTDYIKNNYGSQHRFILSETGFTSYTGGKTDEKLQAAAICYGYYLAEFNDMVDSYVIHRHVDNGTEKAQSLYLGLWNSDPNTEENPTTKKFSWTVFKYMDTSQGASYTNFALSIIGADSWNDIVPGYTASRFN